MSENLFARGNKPTRFGTKVFEQTGWNDDVCVVIPRAGKDALLYIVDRLKWNVWYNANGKTELNDAQKWAMDRTIAGFLLATADCPADNQEPEIITQIVTEYIKENDMCNNCGCCCNGGAPSTIATDNPDMPFIPSEPPETTPNQPDAVDLCDIASQMLGGIEETTIRMNSTFLSIGVTAAALDLIIGAVGKIGRWATVLTPTLLYNIIAPILTFWLAGTFFAMAVDIIGQIKNKYICAILAGTNPAHGKRLWMEEVSRTRTEWGNQMGVYMWFWGHLIRWEKLYNTALWEDGDLWPEYANSVCPCDTSPEPPVGTSPEPEQIDDVGDYFLIPVNILDTGTTARATMDDAELASIKLENLEQTGNVFASIVMSSDLLLEDYNTWETLHPVLLGWAMEELNILDTLRFSGWLCSGSCLNTYSPGSPTLLGDGSRWNYKLTPGGISAGLATPMADFVAANGGGILHEGGANPSSAAKFVKFEWLGVGTHYVRLWLLVGANRMVE